MQLITVELLRQLKNPSKCFDCKYKDKRFGHACTSNNRAGSDHYHLYGDFPKSE